MNESPREAVDVDVGLKEAINADEVRQVGVDVDEGQLNSVDVDEARREAVDEAYGPPKELLEPTEEPAKGQVSHPPASVSQSEADNKGANSIAVSSESKPVPTEQGGASHSNGATAAKSDIAAEVRL